MAFELPQLQGSQINTDYLNNFQNQFGLGGTNNNQGYGFFNTQQNQPLGQMNLDGLNGSNSFFSPQAMQLGNLGLNALNGVVGAYTGLRGLSLAKDQFKLNKDLALTNLSNNANLTNERLATRQASRLRSKGITDTEQIAAAVDSYMKEYGVSGSTDKG